MIGNERKCWSEQRIREELCEGTEQLEIALFRVLIKNH